MHNHRQCGLRARLTQKCFSRWRQVAKVSKPTQLRHSSPPCWMAAKGQLLPCRTHCIVGGSAPTTAIRSVTADDANLSSRAHSIAGAPTASANLGDYALFD